MAGDPSASAGTASWLYHPVFPKHWHRRTLYSLARWVNGIAFRDIQFSPVGKPVIKIAEIKGGISGQTQFTEQVFSDAVHVRRGDLLFSWSGQPETSIDAFWWRGLDGWLNQHSFRVTPADGIDPTFLFYLLRYLKPNFIGIARNKQTTGLGHVTKGDLENIEAAYPDIPEQRAIAHILGTLDDKIELNRRMNETLEAMARALFKSWFVDFDPVRAKTEGRDPGLPQAIADLFPDRLVDSELGEIPEGWEVGTIGAVAAVIDCLHSKKPARLDVGRPLLQLANIRTDGLIDMQDAYLIEESQYRKWVSRMEATTGDCVITNVGRVGAVGQMPLGRTAALGRNMTGIRCKPVFPFPTVVIECLLSQAMRDEITLKMDSGTILDALNVRSIPRLRFVRGTRGVLALYERVARPLRARMEALLSEAGTLAAVRDALLPKLVSGEVRVKDAEVPAWSAAR